MKKILSALGLGLGIVIGVPILILLGALYLLYVPFDIIRYHKMPYYKDFKNKYSFFITSADAVKIYNRIATENLPIEYFKSNDLEYFVKDGQVLLCGWGYDGFEQVDGEWYFVLDEEGNTKMTMKETLENEMVLLKPEHKCLPAKFLFFYKDVTDSEKFEQANQCPYLHCAASVDNL